ncbi:DnaD domain-containing protein [Clostridium botulinum]|uniref:DnaD domain-containing protein n=1 Tax=Clostridium botulinum TaxID=1491 RepID=UPI003A7FF321
MAEGKEKGWISLYRAMEDGWLWEDKPFARGQAWIDLLLQANHKDKKTFSKGELVIVKRGSFLTSDQLLADRWGWSRKKVRTFLEVLVKEQMIELKRSPKGTSLTLVNWDLYQGLGTTEEQQKIQQRDNRRTTEGTTEEQQKNTNNNVNNVNNDNNVNNSSSTTPNYIEFFNNNFHLISSYEAEILNSFEKDGLDPGVVQLALEKAIENGARNIKYVKSILRSWLEKNIKTVEAVRAEQQQFKRQKKDKNIKTVIHKKEDKFNDCEQRNYSKEQLNDLEKKLLGWS